MRREDQETVKGYEKGCGPAREPEICKVKGIYTCISTSGKRSKDEFAPGCLE